MFGPYDDMYKELVRLRKGNRVLREERAILKKAKHPLHLRCKVLDVSQSGYHVW